MRRNGFSLLELSIVLVIVTTILSSLLPTITEGVKVKAIETTIKHMEAIEAALKAHYKANVALPCPAPINASVNAATFGVEDSAANCQAGAAATRYGVAGNVVGGAVPTKTLGLSDEYAFDGWGRRIAYHVDHLATETATFASAGGVTVNGDTGVRATTAIYALISSGRNGHGGYTRGGTPFNSGSTNAHELENCQRGSAPCAGAYNATFVQKMEKADSATVTDRFDDILIYKLPGHLTGAGGGAGGSSFWEDVGSNNIRNSNSGNVGIGTTTPAYKLDVTGTIASNSVSGLELTNPNAQINLWGESPVARKWMLGLSGSAADDDFIIHDREANQTRLMIDENSGNVGIGTPTPSQNMSVHSGNAATTIGITNATTGVTSNDGFVIGVDSSNNAILNQREAADAMFYTNGGNERMRITSAGNVGIGTPTPSYRLTVAANVANSYAGGFINTSTHGLLGQGTQFGVVGYNNTAGGGAVHGFNSATNAYGYIGTNATGVWGRGTGAGQGIYGEATGNNYGVDGRALNAVMGGVVGFAANTGIYGISGHANTYSFYGSGPAYNTGGWSTSDERLKEDITPIEQSGSLDKILQLRPVTFRWRKNADQYQAEKGIQVGLVAQETQKIIPEIVRTVTTPTFPETPDGNGGTVPTKKKSLNDELGETMAVEYGDVVPFLINAVKELNGKIEAVGGGAKAMDDAPPAGEPALTAKPSSASIGSAALPHWLLAVLAAQTLAIVALAVRGRRR